MGGIVNVPQLPGDLELPYCSPNCPPGSFDVAVTPHGEYAFVANEYGTMPRPTSVMSIGGDNRHHEEVKSTRRCWWIYVWIPKSEYIYIPGGDTTGNNNVA